MKSVNTLRAFTILSIVILLPSFAVHFCESPVPNRALQVEIFCTKKIAALKEQILQLKNEAVRKASVTVLRARFRSARKIYKELAVITEYFSVSESRLLNGPALPWVEDDLPAITIAPHGFQVMEEQLFSGNPPAYAAVANEAAHIHATLTRMENDVDRIHQFRDELIWDAMRSSLFRLASLGVTGFDSPIALDALPEALSTLNGIGNLLQFFKDDINELNSTDFESTLKLIRTCYNFIKAAPDFNRFDRLYFISNCIDPLYAKLTGLRKDMGLPEPAGSHPVNFDAGSIFAKDLFRVNFFTPGKDYYPTEERIALGKQLFNDPVLSGDKSRSCASCHIPSKAFTDGIRSPIGIDLKTLLGRNTPTLWNSVIQTNQFYDSRSSTFENQLDEVVHNTREMEGSLLSSAAELKKIPAYVAAFEKAYPKEREAITAFNIANAISSYMRSLLSFDSRFDKHIRKEVSSLTLSEKKGFNLFAGKAKCATCHFLPAFNGLVPPEFVKTESEVLGVPSTTSVKKPQLDPDLGKAGFTKAPVHEYSFKTPTLRNIALTAPYMHNGVFNTLEQVMEFYNKGGGAGLGIAPANQTLPAGQLKLSTPEIKDIIAFLRSLTDTSARH